jgi:hypothetical protein
MQRVGVYVQLVNDAYRHHNVRARSALEETLKSKSPEMQGRDLIHNAREWIHRYRTESW